MKFILLWLSLVAVTAVAQAADEAQLEFPPMSAATAGHLFTIAGSNTIGANLAPAWAEAFLAQKGVTKITREPLSRENELRVRGYNDKRVVYIDIHAHGSSTGFTSLEKGSATIAMSSRPITQSELARLSHLGDLGHVASEHVVAIDGLAVIVHPGNSIRSLTVEQIAKIFTGAISDWQQLGAGSGAINVYARDEKSGTWDTFNSLVLKAEQPLAKGALRFESNDALSDHVADDPAGIGFVGLASVRDAKALAIVDGETAAIEPRPSNVATEDYPLARRLYLYIAREPSSALAQEFISFAQHQLGQQMVEQEGFVSQNPKAVHVSVTDGAAFYQALAAHARRLTINFRFQPGRAELDTKALRDVQRLAIYLKQQQSANSHVQLVGFSNKKDSPVLATVLSRLRATAVKTALFSYGVNTEAVEGYGAERPVADTRSHSASKNDRVEVWVYPAPSHAALEKLKRESRNHGASPGAQSLAQETVPTSPALHNYPACKSAAQLARGRMCHSGHSSMQPISIN